MANSKKSLFCFGPGFSAKVLAANLRADGWQIFGSFREANVANELANQGIEPVPFDTAHATLKEVSCVLSSVPPGADGDPVLKLYGDLISQIFDTIWLGYLSTTGVYGDTGGAMVDETAPTNPSNDRSHRRVKAEQEWLKLSAHVFRLAGIYGQGRSSMDRLHSGLARRIDRPGHLFSRIHAEDIAQTLRASINKPNPGQIYNLCDDEAVEQQEVETYAAQLMGIEPPPLIPFADAVHDMSPMAKTFWQDSRRVDNSKIKQELGIKLIYPTYREGLTAIYQRSDGTG